MRVLGVTMDFPPAVGGIAVFLAYVFEHLARAGHEVDVLAFGDSRAARGVPSNGARRYAEHRASLTKRLSSIRPIVHTCRLALHRTPDVIILGHVMSTHGLGAVLARRVMRVPYVVLSHGGDLQLASVSHLDGRAVRAVLDNSALILGNSKFTCDTLAQLGYPSHRIGLLNPGVDTDLFYPRFHSGSFLAKHGIGDNRVILSVGRLVAKKNHRAVVAALPRVLKTVPDLCYLIVGDGPERRNIQADVARLGINQHVVFMGAVSHRTLPALYSVCDILVMPSKTTSDNFESFGIVFMEAAACGKPAIAGRSGGMLDAVLDGVTGLVVDPSDPDDIAQAIIRLLTDQAYAAMLGRNARERAVQHFSWSRVTARLEAVLRQVCAGRGQ